MAEHYQCQNLNARNPYNQGTKYLMKALSST